MTNETSLTTNNYMDFNGYRGLKMPVADMRCTFVAHGEGSNIDFYEQGGNNVVHENVNYDFYVNKDFSTPMPIVKFSYENDDGETVSYELVGNEAINFMKAEKENAKEKNPDDPFLNEPEIREWENWTNNQ